MASVYMTYINGWLLHGIINLLVEDADKNLSQNMLGIPEMSQI